MDPEGLHYYWYNGREVRRNHIGPIWYSTGFFETGGYWVPIVHGKRKWHANGIQFVGISVSTVTAVESIAVLLVLKRYGLDKLPTVKDLGLSGLIGAVTETIKKGWLKNQGYYIIRIGVYQLR